MTPAAPRFALIRLYASQTWRLEMANGFALPVAFIPSPVDATDVLDNAAPSLELAFTSRHHYYGLLRPCAAHRYALPREVRSLDVLPSHRDDRFSRSA